MLFLISWGFTGHRVIALIAERHLTPQAKAAVADLLVGESMAEVSTWADQVRNQGQYKHTSGWHFINLPLGLSHTEFNKTVVLMEKDNVYSAVRKAQQNLMNPKLSKAERSESLKFLIHLVGDLHQPMHVSRAEDKGGNTVQLNFEGKGTNLHSLWDSRLIDKKGLSEAQLVNEYDKIPPATITKWQQTPMIDWIWESYQASSKLYAEVDQMKSRAIGEDYYKSHIAIVDQRIEQAGIRLAAMLNEIYKGKGPYDGNLLAPPSQDLPAETQDSTADFVPINELKANIGKQLGTEGKVFGYKDFGSMVLLNVGAAYPNQPLTVVLRGKAKELATKVDGKEITIIGKVSLYKAKPQIEVSNPKDIIIH
ncbi:S1/P1 nuclease [Mucilaginibacter sp. CSA2-8R]|uniref:S1/P1 nuclease n=1 Tax=Mucilaginibacter sp. CSA2-8R TaxID=3141542 RepID=UPI00315D776B